MKTFITAGILLIGISGQAFSMGHPHNMFAARKQMQSKTSTSVAKNKVTSSVCWQQTVQETKLGISERFLTALARICPARGAY